MEVFRNCLKLSIAGVAMALTSCSAEVELIQPLEPFQAEAYAKYTQYSSKPMVSALDMSLGKVNPTRSADYTIGLTQADIDYLNSLDVEGLEQLKKQLMDENGINSDEELEKMLDDVYDQLTAQMTGAQLVKFNKFLETYLEQPCDQTPNEYFNAFKSYLDGTQNDEVIITTAVSVDYFGRKLYLSNDLAMATRSIDPDFCLTIYRARVAIAVIGCAWGLYLPGPATLVIIAAVGEYAYGTSEYYRCMRS